MRRLLAGVFALFFLLVSSSVSVPLVHATVPAAGQLIISEFRVRGPSGANDEFIEIYNTLATPFTVTGASGTGIGVAASDGITRCSIPNGTVIPAHGHYLCTNSIAYSLGSYPSGNGTTATGDATYATDIPDNAGIALFNNNVPADYNLANRLDAVGSTSEANVLYKEGTGYPALIPFSIDYSFYRDTCGKGGSITTMGACSQAGLPKDTNNNAADFVFVDTNGTSAGAGQRLGAPGPQNLSSPVFDTTGPILVSDIDPGCTGLSLDINSACTIIRGLASIPAENSTFGTLVVRKRFTNNTGGNITRLRFNIVDLTTFPAPSGFADLRPITSADSTSNLSGGGTVSILGTTLEQPPAQPNGGGFNTTYSAGTVTLGTPLANGASINLQFTMGSQQTGDFKFGVNVEALPLGGAHFRVEGTEPLTPPLLNTAAASAITAVSATLGGSIIDQGGSTVTQRGVVVSAQSVNPNPAIGGTGVSTFIDGAGGTGSFSESATGLTGSTMYAFRAFATNTQGTSYGQLRTFTTLAATPPTVTTTSPATSIAGTSATLSGNVSAGGSGSLTGRGIVFATTAANPSPTIGGAGVTQLADATAVLGVFSENASGLTPTTAYTFRAYASNSGGATAYGAPVAFTTLVGAMPTVTTTAPATGITQNTASLSGNVTATGDTPLTARGIVLADLSVNPTPAIGGAGVTQLNDAAATAGAFTENAAGLLPGTNYAFRAFATNGAGTSYGAVVTFTTLTTPGAPGGGTTKTGILNQNAPQVTKSFTPSSVAVGGTSTMRITISNPTLAAMTGVNLVDNMPAGIKIASAAVTGTCGAGLFAVSPASLSLAGGTLPAAGSCTFTVTVTGTTAGNWLNQVQASANGTGFGAAGAATLIVGAPPIPTKGLPVP